MFRYLTGCCLIVVLACAACSQATSPSQNNPSALITITNSFLKANSTHLSGTLTVYPENSTSKIAQVDLLFAGDENGNITVTSPSIKLKKSTIFRFVVTFYWDEIPFAYVDTTQATGNEDTDEISFTESLIIYSASSNPDVSTSISEGVLPNLDEDEDGYSNFEELRAGTNPNDAASVPDGPAIVWNNLTAGKSVDGTIELFITATDKDNVSSVLLLNPSNITDNSSLADTFAGQWDTTSLADGDFALKARATDTLGNVSESELIVNISNKVDRSGPKISFKVYQIINDRQIEVDINNGQSVYDVIQVEVRAEDATGVSSLTLSSDSDFDSILQPTQEPGDTEIRFKLDTTLVVVEKTEKLLFQASDIRGQTSEKALNLPVKNNPTINSLQLKEQEITENSTLTLSALQPIAVKWNAIFADNIRLEKGESCSLTNQAILEQSQLSIDSDFNLSSTLGSGKYLFCFYRTGKNISEEAVTFTSSHPINITWDDDEDSFRNEDDCGPLNKLSYPGNTRAYLMDDDYNCDGDSKKINLAEATYTFLGDDIENYAGLRVSYAGDVNGDGCSDILIDSQYHAEQPEVILGSAYEYKRKIYLIYGNGPTCKYQNKILQHSNLFDVGVSIPGATFLGEVPIEQTSIAGAGDINMDGCDDILIGSPYYNNYGQLAPFAGRAYLIWGRGARCSNTREIMGINLDLNNPSPAFSGVIFESEQYYSLLGFSIAGLGDITNSGVPSFAIGHPGYGKRTLDWFGAYYVININNLSDKLKFTMSSTAPFMNIINFDENNNLDDSFLGGTIVPTGDTNGDNIPDMLVSTKSANINDDINEGFFLFHGNLLHTLDETPLTADLLTDNTFVFYDLSASAAGYLNADNYNDIIIGDTNILSLREQNTGGIHLHLGGINQNKNTAEVLYPTVTIFGEALNDEAGKAVSGNGDINKDGTMDMLVSAPGSNLNGESSGTIYIINGSEALDILDLSGSLFKLTGENEADYIGQSVSLNAGYNYNTTKGNYPMVGDFNGDRCADPLIGAPYYGSDDNGKVYLILSGYCE